MSPVSTKRHEQRVTGEERGAGVRRGEREVGKGGASGNPHLNVISFGAVRQSLVPTADR